VNISQEWDAATYDTLPLPHKAWGDRVLAELELRGNECVLDAGSGTGRDTLRLLRMTSGQVIAVDASVKMLDQLRSKLPDDVTDRVRIVQADLTEPLPTMDPVDAIFSVATFHWIVDHAGLFRNLASVLRPSGRIAFECGGYGNVEAVSSALERAGLSDPSVWNFAHPDDTSRRLEAAGLEVLSARLRPDPITLDPGPQLEAFLATVILGGHLAKIPKTEWREVVAQVAAYIPDATIDYVRLEATARKTN
jgi:trans-aconitate 2-methyltransferase